MRGRERAIDSEVARGGQAQSALGRDEIQVSTTSNPPLGPWVAPPAMRTADAVVRALAEADVNVVFGIPGVHTLALYDALARSGTPRHVLVRHEQAAAFAADGYGRISSRPGVCLATTGPGAFNMIAALAEAYSDSSPVVVLAGQIPVDAIGRERGLLHEVADQALAFEPVTKAVWRPRTSEALREAVVDALAAAVAGRPAWRRKRSLDRWRASCVSRTRARRFGSPMRRRTGLRRRYGRAMSDARSELRAPSVPGSLA